jgi:hypothetical protein
MISIHRHSLARRLVRASGTLVGVAILATGCGDAAPAADSLKDSFAQQLAANEFLRDFKREGDEMTFSGPGADGGTAMWRVRIDSAVVEENTSDAAKHPYKGTVKSSWFSDGQPVLPSARESNLPIELISNGLSQDCWALWEPEPGRWGWE